jgi:hypothetical protein
VLAQHARQASGRGLVLMPAAALVVHQVRYSLAYGSQASTELADQGHAYLSSLVPWIVVLVAIGLGRFVTRLAHALVTGRADWRARPFLGLWGTTASGLIAIYVLQELLEGLFANGHPPGFAGVFGHGGWWSIPAAIAVSLATVVGLRLGQKLVKLATRSSRASRRLTITVTVLRPAALQAARRTPLAFAAAGRAPPALRTGY